MSLGRESLATVTVDGVRDFVDAESLDDALARARGALDALTAGACPGNEFLGWKDLPERMRGPLLDRVIRSAERLRQRHRTLVVIGIGGSSLGTRAALNALSRGADEVPLPADAHPVVFAGHHLDGDTLTGTLATLADEDYAVNVISKSGTTTEPGIAFRILLDDLRRRFPDDWASRVVATTDPGRGALREMALELGLEILEVPPDVGGRFSVLSAVGLLPLAFAGADMAGLLDGAAAMARATLHDISDANPALRLAAARNAVYHAGYSVDVLAFTSPRLRRFALWWQQLFGESEGKQQQGPFPAVCEIPADLHSLGQYMQDGTRQVYETVLHVEPAGSPGLTVPDGDSRDGLDYLAGRPIAEVLEAARRGTIDAHLAGGVPVLEVTLPRLDERTLGAAFFLFEVTVALGGLMLGVNPFDQPGVEAYKRNMFRRLGKPGA